MSKSIEDFPPQKIDRFLHAINTLFYLIVCVPLLLFIIIYLMLQKAGGISPAFEPEDATWHYLVSVLLVFIVVPAVKGYKKKLKTVKEGMMMADKLAVFKRAALTRYLFLGTGCLTAVLFLYFTGEQIYLMAFGALLIFFSINRPTPYRVIKDVKLTANERKAVREYRKYL